MPEVSFIQRLAPINAELETLRAGYTADNRDQTETAFLNACSRIAKIYSDAIRNRENVTGIWFRTCHRKALSQLAAKIHSLRNTLSLVELPSSEGATVPQALFHSLFPSLKMKSQILTQSIDRVRALGDRCHDSEKNAIRAFYTVIRDNMSALDDIQGALGIKWGSPFDTVVGTLRADHGRATEASFARGMDDARERVLVPSAYDRIVRGKSQIRVEGSHYFRLAILGGLFKLSQWDLGRALLERIEFFPQPLVIQEGNTCCSYSSEGTITMCLSEAMSSRGIVMDSRREETIESCSIGNALAHEMIHRLHYLEDPVGYVNERPIAYPEFTNLEERYTILGDSPSRTSPHRFYENAFRRLGGLRDRTRHTAAFFSENASITDRGHDGMSPLHDTAQLGILGTMRELLSRGISPNVRTNTGDSPLHYALQGRRLGALKLLLSNGADVNARTNTGATPLHVASQNGGREFVEALCAAHADINALNAERETPLHCAIREGRLEIIVALLSKNANVHIATKTKKETPLHYAASKNDHGTAGLLLAKGANIHATNHIGETFLHYAVTQKNMDLLRLAKTCGANLDAINHQGQTALHYAVMLGFREGVQFLLENGANVRTKDKEMHDPLYYAVVDGNRSMIQLILSFHADIDIRSVVGCRMLLNGSDLSPFSPVPSYLENNGLNAFFRTFRKGWNAASLIASSALFYIGRPYLGDGLAATLSGALSAPPIWNFWNQPKRLMQVPIRRFDAVGEEAKVLYIAMTQCGFVGENKKIAQQRLDVLLNRRETVDNDTKNLLNTLRALITRGEGGAISEHTIDYDLDKLYFDLASQSKIPSSAKKRHASILEFLNAHRSSVIICTEKRDALCNILTAVVNNESSIKRLPFDVRQLRIRAQKDVANLGRISQANVDRYTQLATLHAANAAYPLREAAHGDLWQIHQMIEESKPGDSLFSSPPPVENRGIRSIIRAGFDLNLSRINVAALGAFVYMRNYPLIMLSALKFAWDWWNRPVRMMPIPTQAFVNRDEAVKALYTDMVQCGLAGRNKEIASQRHQAIYRQTGTISDESREMLETISHVIIRGDCKELSVQAVLYDLERLYFDLASQTNMPSDAQKRFLVIYNFLKLHAPSPQRRKDLANMLIAAIYNSNPVNRLAFDVRKLKIQAQKEIAQRRQVSEASRIRYRELFALHNANSAYLLREEARIDLDQIYRAINGIAPPSRAASSAPVSASAHVPVRSPISPPPRTATGATAA